MSGQVTFAEDQGLSWRRKVTKRERFLSEMDAMAPLGTAGDLVRAVVGVNRCPSVADVAHPLSTTMACLFGPSPSPTVNMTTN